MGKSSKMKLLNFKVETSHISPVSFANEAPYCPSEIKISGIVLHNDADFQDLIRYLEILRKNSKKVIDSFLLDK